MADRYQRNVQSLEDSGCCIQSDVRVLKQMLKSYLREHEVKSFVFIDF